MAWRTRFAPAPTGYLHLGHIVNAIHVWGIARAFGGEVLLRIEDHDRTRCRREYEDALLDDLDWLGFVPDIGRTDSFRAARHGQPHPQRQSDHEDRYAAALAALSARGLTYACTCTRRDIARHVPHAMGEEPRYPGTCRDAGHAEGQSLARRVRMADGVVPFDDRRLGPMRQSPAAQCGDLLGRERPLQWWHHPLLVHPDGTKLSKANHDTSIRERRAAGAYAEALLGEAAFLSGLLPAARDLSIDELPALFR